MNSREDVLQLVTEKATLEKRDVLTGRIRVSTRTEFTEEPVSAELAHEDVVVTRVPIEKPIETAPSIRTEGEVTIIPVIEEILVVEKRLFLKEEIHIRRTANTETVEVPVTLRKQSAVIERDNELQTPVEEDN